MVLRVLIGCDDGTRGGNAGKTRGDDRSIGDGGRRGSMVATLMLMGGGAMVMVAHAHTSHG